MIGCCHQLRPQTAEISSLAIVEPHSGIRQPRFRFRFALLEDSLLYVDTVKQCLSLIQFLVFDQVMFHSPTLFRTFVYAGRPRLQNILGHVNWPLILEAPPDSSLLRDFARAIRLKILDKMLGACLDSQHLCHFR